MILGVLRLDMKTEYVVQRSRSALSTRKDALGVTNTPGITLVSGGDMLAVASTTATTKVSPLVRLVNPGTCRFCYNDFSIP